MSSHSLQLIVGETSLYCQSCGDKYIINAVLVSRYFLIIIIEFSETCNVIFHGKIFFTGHKIM